MKIEQTIRRLETIADLQSLEQYLSEVGNAAPYKWCSLVVKDQQLRYFGNVQSDGFTDCAGHLRTHLELRNCKPYNLVYQPSEQASVCSVFIPLKTNGHEFAALTLGVDTRLGTDKIEKLTWYWQILAIYIYDACCRFFSPSGPEFHLSKREQECLEWACQGKTSWEISQILGISERTVNFHMSNCIHKTDSVNRQQLIAKYMKNFGLAA